MSGLWVTSGKQSSNSNIGMYVYTRDGRFGSKVGQIGPKSDKSGAFSDQISVHLALKPTIPALTPTSLDNPLVFYS